MANHNLPHVFFFFLFLAIASMQAVLSADITNRRQPFLVDMVATPRADSLAAFSLLTGGSF